MKRFFLLIVAVLVFSGPLMAQSVTVKAGATKLLYDSRHFPVLYGESAPTIPSVGVKFGWKDYSDSPYALICNHPEYGIAFQVDGLADAPAVNGPGLGNVYSVFGFFDRDIIQAGRFSFGYTGGFGLGICPNKLYNPETNPWNLIFSTPVNSHITFGFQARYLLTPRYFTGVGFNFNHYSNGATNFPNRGFNGFELSLLFGMNASDAVMPVPKEPVDDGFKRHFQFDVQFSGGVMGNEAYYDYYVGLNGGGKNMHYPKFAFQADCLYKYCRTHATGIGFDMFVTPFCDEITKYLYLYRQLDNPDATEEHFEPVSFGISIVHEMCYRNLSLTAGVGRYLYDNDGLARNKILYQLVNIKYHFPDFADTYAGIVLKAHKFMAAESIQLCIGKRF